MPDLVDIGHNAVESGELELYMKNINLYSLYDIESQTHYT